MDTQLCIALALIVASITTAGVPWPRNVNVTIGTFFVTGLGYGVEETSLYLYMLYLWGSECEPFMQALHFSFGVGASVAPLIASRFILPRNDSFPDEWTPDDVQVHWCFEIIAVVCILTAAIFIFLYKCPPPSDEHPSRSCVSSADDEDKDVGKGAKSHPKLNQTRSLIEQMNAKRKEFIIKSLCIMLLCIFCFFYCGIEVNFGAYLTPYAVDGPLHMTKENGAYIAAVYWSVFTFSRLLTIFYIKKIGSRSNLILCCFIILIANIVLLPFQENETCLWVGSVLVGLGASSILASIFGYLEQNIRITPLITSFTIASGALGMSVFPIITSQFFDEHQSIFLWLTLIAAILMAIFLTLIIIFFNYYGRLVRETIERKKNRTTIRPSFGRLNSIMSVASDSAEMNKKMKKRNKKAMKPKTVTEGKVQP